MKINYLNTSMSQLIKKKTHSPIKYNLIIASEVVEHVEDRTKFFSDLSKLLENEGVFVLTTINKTLSSLFFAKFMAEDILKILPKNTPNNIQPISSSVLLLFDDEDDVSYFFPSLSTIINTNIASNYFTI